MLEANEFSAPVLRDLRTRYRTSANTTGVITDGLRELEAARRFNGADTAVSVAALESFIADVLISVAQSAPELHQALELSSRALVRLESIRIRSEEIRSLAVHTALLNGIAHKAIGDRDEAFAAIERHTSRLVARLDIDWLHAIPLRRQVVLMSQSNTNFSALAQEAIAYKTLRPVEYYTSLKRFFEYLLNHHKVDLARTTFPLLREAYSLASHGLAPTAHVSFLKNSGQYLLIDGYPRKGSELLLQALRPAAQFSMHGQVRQINHLLNEASGGDPTLEVFRL